MFLRLLKFIYARYRAFAPLSCLQSPRSDVVSGLRRWKWLVMQRRSGRMVDPTVTIWCGERLDQRLEMMPGATLDRGVIVWLGEVEESKGKIRIGTSAYIGPNTFLGSCHELNIGDNVMIGGNSYLITVNHRTDLPGIPFSKQGFCGGPVKIGSNVWLGCHVVVLPGVCIGDGAIIGAGAVVTKNVPDGETWGGVPAKRLKEAK